jgi:hypothetical protein
LSVQYYSEIYTFPTSVVHILNRVSTEVLFSLPAEYGIF